VAVVPGEGNRRLFESYGAARVIEGGQTMNPSTADIVAAIDATPATEVLVLPNNSNVILAAQQAVEHAAKPARVIPSRSVQAGLAAIVRYLPSLSAEENEASMNEALEQVATGEVTVASRDVELDGVAVRKGAYLGLAQGQAVASSPDFQEVACAVVDRLLSNGAGVLTILTGDEEPELTGVLNRIEERHPDVELDVHPGGQPHYPLLLSAE
jgi:dihydroxyacetone kinase-like predicted kinase